MRYAGRGSGRQDKRKLTNQSAFKRDKIDNILEKPLAERIYFLALKIVFLSG